MARTTSPVLGHISPREFLKTYWQKQPLVIRGAFPALLDPLSPDALAGLACEPSTASRLVMERGGRGPWEVTRGPQKSRRLQRLPKTHWTLLVESVDRHSPEVAALAAAFSFLPRWRMDDVMVSLSPLHGTVGAHIDSYDVFLIQGQGRRRWEIERSPARSYKPGLDLRILERFRAEESWTLESGDMLYVPPGVAHRGVTVAGGAEIALTYSVGFRAPALTDLLTAVLARRLEGDSPALFSDFGRSPVSDPTEVCLRDLAELRRFLVAGIDEVDGNAWALAAGEAVSSGGMGFSATRVPSSRSIARRLTSGSWPDPVPEARLAWARLGAGKASLFINGESRVLPRRQAFAASFLCGRQSLSSARRFVGDPELISLLRELLRAGVVQLTGSFGRRKATRTRKVGGSKP